MININLKNKCNIYDFLKRQHEKEIDQKETLTRYLRRGEREKA